MIPIGNSFLFFCILLNDILVGALKNSAIRCLGTFRHSFAFFYILSYLGKPNKTKLDIELLRKYYQI